MSYHTGLPINRHFFDFELGATFGGRRYDPNIRRLSTTLRVHRRPIELYCHVIGIVGIGAGIPTNFLGLPKDDDGNTIALSEDMPVEGSVDEWAHATPEEAIEYAGKAARLEGMMVGPSAGAALKVALEIACRDEAAGKTIVAILASHGIRYVAHPMWGAIKAEAAAALPVPPNMDKEAEVVQWKSSEYSPK